jgi:hypothetical protein
MLAACGSDSSGSEGPTGTYRVDVENASFPTLQRLGQTSLLQLGLHNSGRKTVPELTVTFTIAGEEGVDSTLPFGVRDPQPALAQADRPVWVLAARYPRLAGSDEPGGTETANRKTFNFGPLKPGETTDAVWKLSAVREGKFTLIYRVDASITGSASAVTRGDVSPGGSFATEISAELPETEVTDSGEIREIQPKSQRGESAPE